MKFKTLSHVELFDFKVQLTVELSKHPENTDKINKLIEAIQSCDEDFVSPIPIQSTPLLDKTEKHDVGKQRIKMIVSDTSSNSSTNSDLNNSQAVEQNKKVVGKSSPSSCSPNPSNGSAKVYEPEDLRIFLRFFAENVNENTLKNHFERYGPISDVYIPKDAKGKPTQKAFITFSALNGKSSIYGQHRVEGMTFTAYKVKVPASNQIFCSHTIMLTGILDNISNTKLQKYFSQFGTMQNTKRTFDFATGKFKRFAFIVYKETKSVDAAVQKMHHSVDGQVIDVRRVANLK